VSRPSVETAPPAAVKIQPSLTPVTPALCQQHPSVFPASLRAFDEIIVDPVRSRRRERGHPVVTACCADGEMTMPATGGAIADNPALAFVLAVSRSTRPADRRRVTGADESG
jgi:hypothetical protein